MLASQAGTLEPQRPAILAMPLEVRHRHDARHDRHVDAGRRRVVAEAQEIVGLEEELGDAAVGAGIDLALQVLEVGLGVGRSRDASRDSPRR